MTTAIKAVDCIAYADDNINSYLDRNYIYQIQTPQVFHFNLILNCYKKYFENLGKNQNSKEFTDDTSLVYEYSKIKAKIIEGDKRLFKITNIEDLKYAEFSVKNSLL